MLKKALLTMGGLVLAVLVAYAVLYANNKPPAVATVEGHNSKPYVVKLHAQWCPVCMATKGVWTEIAGKYGSRVNLVVFDFTDDDSTTASAKEATRLGLSEYFQANSGWTGTISVLDADGKELSSIRGSRKLEDYGAAIDAALAATMSP